MSDIGSSLEHLGKQYRIAKRARCRALHDVITAGVATPFRRLASLGRHASNGHANGADTPDILWALEDASFEARRGEVLGIAFYQSPDTAWVRQPSEWSGMAPATAPYGTNMFGYRGVAREGIVFGPGSIERAHRDVKWVDLSERAKAATVYERWWGLA